MDLVIREIQFKITKSYQYVSITIALKKQTLSSDDEDREQLKRLYATGGGGAGAECKLVQPFWKNVLVI